MTLTVSPKKLSLVLLVIVLGLTLADVASQYLLFFKGYDFQLGLRRQLDLRSENNLPTWYSSSALLLAAGFLVVIGLVKKQTGDRYARQWLGLSMIFLFLSLDEAASLHEMTAEPLRKALRTSGYLYYAWVIPGSLAVLIVGLTYLRFLRDLPVKTRSLFLLAGTLFVGGELGMEMLEGTQASLFGEQTLTYSIMVALEESLAMLGVVVFVYALASYMSLYLSEVRVLISDETPKVQNNVH